MSSEILNPTLHFGSVIRVTGASVELELHNTQTPESAGSRPRTGLGNFVAIDVGELACFARITELKMAGLSEGNAKAGHEIAVVQLWATIDLETSSLVRGVKKYPAVGDSAYLMSQNAVSAIAEKRMKEKAKQGVSIDFANLADAFEIPVNLAPEALYGRHCAIVGSSGGGKSWTVARLIEQTSQFKSKTILIDATGEYDSLRSGAVHAYLGEHPEPPENSVAASMPYYELTEQDIFSIFRPDRQAQGPKLSAAIRTLKLLSLEPSLGLNGLFPKANREKDRFELAERNFGPELEKPNAFYDIRRIPKQIKHECVFPYRSTTELDVWGAPNSAEESLCLPLTNRIFEILSSSTLSPIFELEERRSVFEIIDAFLEADQARVLVISLQYLSYAHHAREIVANSLGRYLLKLARDGRFLENPLLLVVDEAHNFLKEGLEADSAGYALDSFALIAKEARKYSLSLCLATQRPRDIPESIFSQMGTILVHRLTNDFDRSVIERSCAGMDTSSIESLPTLTAGEAVLTGVDFAIPMRVNIQAPQHPPQSLGPNFQQYWQET